MRSTHEFGHLDLAHWSHTSEFAQAAGVGPLVFENLDGLGANAVEEISFLSDSRHVDIQRFGDSLFGDSAFDRRMIMKCSWIALSRLTL